MINAGVKQAKEDLFHTHYIHSEIRIQHKDTGNFRILVATKKMQKLMI